MLWSRQDNTIVTILRQIVNEIIGLRKDLGMDFTTLNDTIAKLGTDVIAEVAAAKAAIVAAQGGDPTALAAAVTALNNIDAAVTGATTAFTPAGTSTVPPPPAV